MSSHHEPDRDGVSIDDFFQVDEKQFAGSQFIMDKVRTFQDAYLQEKCDHGLTQQIVAERLGLSNRSIVNRWLKGRENMSERSIGELAWALGYRAKIILERIGIRPTPRSEEWAPEARVVSAPINDAWKRHAQKQENADAILENV